MVDPDTQFTSIVSKKKLKIFVAILVTGLTVGIIYFRLNKYAVQTRVTELPIEPCPSLVKNDSVEEVNGKCWKLTSQLIIEGLDKPIGVASPVDGSSRLFIIEKKGVIRIIQNGTVVESPFLDISDNVGSEGDEQGLLGTTFHPDFTNNGYFFVNYTDRDGNTVVSRLKVSGDNLNKADIESETVVLTLLQPKIFHNGGNLAFGPDGYLYISTGDSARLWPAQDGESLLGKILRVNINADEQYPYPESTGDNVSVFTKGLRNPWRFSFDRVTGDLYISDNGDDMYEEINVLPADSTSGGNFGWPHFEGNHCTSELYTGSYKYAWYQGANCEFKHNKPVFEYFHSPPTIRPENGEEDKCSGAVIGGYAYRGQEFPELNGVYIFADFCTGTIWGMKKDESGKWQTDELLLQSKLFPTSFGEDENGEIYLVTFNGELYKIGAEIKDLL